MILPPFGFVTCRWGFHTPRPLWDIWANVKLHSSVRRPDVENFRRILNQL